MKQAEIVKLISASVNAAVAQALGKPAASAPAPTAQPLPDWIVEGKAAEATRTVKAKAAPKVKAVAVKVCEDHVFTDDKTGRQYPGTNIVTYYDGKRSTFPPKFISDDAFNMVAAHKARARK